MLEAVLLLTEGTLCCLPSTPSLPRGTPAFVSLAREQVSEIDLKVGVFPGLPVSLTGTVVTKARLSPIRWEFIRGTSLLL